MDKVDNNNDRNCESQYSIKSTEEDFLYAKHLRTKRRYQNWGIKNNFHVKNWLATFTHRSPFSKTFQISNQKSIQILKLTIVSRLSEENFDEVFLEE